MKQYLLFKELGESSELARPKFLELPLEERIKKLNVVDTGLDLLGNRVKKQPVGPNYIGLCPFHIERTPSFNLKSLSSSCLLIKRTNKTINIIAINKTPSVIHPLNNPSEDILKGVLDVAKPPW